MHISKLSIKNIASFCDFSTEDNLKKTCLFFGTNGSGKSTIAQLLQIIDRYKTTGETEDLGSIIEFFRSRFSKESFSDDAQITLCFDSDEVIISYDKITNNVQFSNDLWYPIKVFNERYTEKTIGEQIDISIDESGIVIGEPNRQLIGLQQKSANLAEQIAEYEQIINDLLIRTTNEYAQKANSKADVSAVISKENLLKPTCAFEDDSTCIQDRADLGYSNPTDTLQRLQLGKLNSYFQIDIIEKAFQETVTKPQIDENKEEFLLEFTDFYRDGVQAYGRFEKAKCPFCFREWPSSQSIVDSYKEFLSSTFNQKRESIKKYKDLISSFETTVEELNNRGMHLTPLIQTS